MKQKNTPVGGINFTMNYYKTYWRLGIEGVAKLGAPTSEEVKRLEEPNR